MVDDAIPYIQDVWTTVLVKISPHVRAHAV